MKKRLMFLTITIFSLMWLSFIHTKAYADEKDSSATQQELNKTERLKDKFGVSDSTIKNLRDQKLGFGEIDSTLALAKQMPGGLTDENIQQVLELRQGDGTHKKGWGNVAKKLGVKMGDIKRNNPSPTVHEPSTKISPPRVDKNNSSSKLSSPGRSFPSHARGK